MTKIDQKALDQIMCVIGHDCANKLSKRCAVCILDFQYLSEDPAKLACGHSICAKCKANQEKEKASCKFHGVRKIGKDATESKQFIKENLNELFNMMKEKFEKAIDLFEGLKKEFFVKKTLSIIIFIFNIRNRCRF